MHILITGAGGMVGRFVTARMLDEGHQVTALGRAPVKDMPVGFSFYDLSDPAPVLPEADAIIHSAFHHEAGKFRGGEGADPELFRRLNVDGTRALFRSAREAGCRRAVFLSSRAVYGDHRRGEVLSETDEPLPDTLYGTVKHAGEQILADLCDERFSGYSLRATGVYGLAPGLPNHKWSGLFEDFLAGRAIEPRCGTEVHGDDLAAAVSLVLNHSGQRAHFEIFNASDLVLDRNDLLTRFRSTSGQGGEPPPASASRPGTMATDKLRSLGWTPGGTGRLNAFLEACC